MCSRNISVQNSPGFTRKDDPAYTGLPADSRKPPAPVDPSSAYFSHPPLKALSDLTRFFAPSSLEVVLHRVSSGIDLFVATSHCVVVRRSNKDAVSHSARRPRPLAHIELRAIALAERCRACLSIMYVLQSMVGQPVVMEKAKTWRT